MASAPVHRSSGRSRFQPALELGQGESLAAQEYSSSQESVNGDHGKCKDYIQIMVSELG